MSLKVTDNQYGRLSCRQLGFMLYYCYPCSLSVFIVFVTTRAYTTAVCSASVGPAVSSSYYAHVADAVIDTGRHFLRQMN